MKTKLFSRVWGGLRSKLVVVGMLLLGLMVLPTRGHGQFGIDLAVIQAGLSTISNLLQSVVAKPLGSIQQLEQQTGDFEQQVVWPISAINQARATASQLQGVVAQTNQLTRISVASATLPISQKLEHSLLSASPGTVQQISADYAAVYGVVPAASDAPQPLRDLIDMTDAAAQSAMKKAVELDALADIELQTAAQISQQLQSAAPGSTPILDAQAAAWIVRANAYTQSALAESMRLRAIGIANQGAQLKFSAAHNSSLRNTNIQVLQPAAR